MTQVEARRLAKILNDNGVPALADNFGGWGGQPNSQVWRVVIFGGYEFAS